MGTVQTIGMVQVEPLIKQLVVGTRKTFAKDVLTSAYIDESMTKRLTAYHLHNVNLKRLSLRLP